MVNKIFFFRVQIFLENFLVKIEQGQRENKIEKRENKIEKRENKIEKRENKIEKRENKIEHNVYSSLRSQKYLSTSDR
jgi:uncharacterized protein (DUF3084 family)